MTIMVRHAGFYTYQTYPCFSLQYFLFKPQPSFPDCAFLPIAESTGVGEAGKTKNWVNSEFVVKMASLSNR